MSKKKRVVSLLIAFAFLFVMLFSAFYIAAEANHDCVGANCRVCCQINACRDTLKNLSLGVCAAAFAAVFSYVLCRSISSCADIVRGYTLVSLKIKLTD